MSKFLDSVIERLEVKQSQKGGWAFLTVNSTFLIHLDQSHGERQKMNLNYFFFLSLPFFFLQLPLSPEMISLCSLASNSQRRFCFCLPIAGINCVYHHPTVELLFKICAAGTQFTAHSLTPVREKLYP